MVVVTYEYVDGEDDACQFEDELDVEYVVVYVVEGVEEVVAHDDEEDVVYVYVEAEE